MGILDPLINGLIFALGLNKKYKKFKQSDHNEFIDSLSDFIVVSRALPSLSSLDEIDTSTSKLPLASSPAMFTFSS